MVLTAYVELSPVTGLFCHRRPRSKVLSKPGWADLNSANLTPASGRQDHTILPSAATSLVGVLLIAHGVRRTRPAIPSRAKRCRVHRIPCPTSVTIAKRPSVWDGMRNVLDVIWGVRKQKYFCIQDWTGQITLIQFNKLARARTGLSDAATAPTARCVLSY
jgi:hypothetical protein